MRTHLLVLLGAVSFSGCFDNPAPDDATELVRAHDSPRLVSAQEALAGAHLPTLDPATMNDAEISKVIGSGAFCAFRYTSDGKPVLAWRRSRVPDRAPAAVKINGQLVALNASSSTGPLEFSAGDVSLQFTAPRDVLTAAAQEQQPTEADLIFEVGKDLRVGYRGYVVCSTG